MARVNVTTVLLVIVLAVGVGTAAVEVTAGNYATCFIIAVWSGLCVANWREWRKWQRGEHPASTKRFIEAEKRDRAAFARQVLLLKSLVASKAVERARELGLLDDPEMLDMMRGLYREVANTWIPEDADPDLVKLKELAKSAADTGEWRTLH